MTTVRNPKALRRHVSTFGEVTCKFPLIRRRNEYTNFVLDNNGELIAIVEKGMSYAFGFAFGLGVLWSIAGAFFYSGLVLGNAAGFALSDFIAAAVFGLLTFAMLFHVSQMLTAKTIELEHGRIRVSYSVVGIRFKQKILTSGEVAVSIHEATEKFDGTKKWVCLFLYHNMLSTILVAESREAALRAAGLVWHKEIMRGCSIIYYDYPPPALPYF